jgi:hypothetical protein
VFKGLKSISLEKFETYILDHIKCRYVNVDIVSMKSLVHVLSEPLFIFSSEACSVPLSLLKRRHTETFALVSK